MSAFEELKKTLVYSTRGWLVSERAVRFAARAAALLFGMGAVVVMATYMAAKTQGLLVSYNAVADVVVSIVLVLCSTACLLFPQRLESVLWVVIVSLAAYLQGNLYFDLFVAPREALFHVAALALFLPFSYIAAFLLTGRKYASTTAWAYTLATLAQCAVALLEGRSITADTDYFLLCMLIAQPLYTLTLTMVTLLRNQALMVFEEQLNQKATLLSMLSHEIRTPLQTILSSIELLELRVKNDQERQPLSRIRASATRLDGYLRDVITYNKTDSAKGELFCAPFDLGELMQDVVNLYRHEATVKELALTLEVDAEARYVRGDAERVKQVVTNLLTNAIKYTPRGSVELKALPVPQHPRLVSISVRDTGVGIEPSQHELIWKPFARTAQAKRSAIEGSGLGLAVVKLLVQAMQGTIRLESAVGQGSTFTVVLPLLDA